MNMAALLLFIRRRNAEEEEPAEENFPQNKTSFRSHSLSAKATHCKR